jgi:hypothetical protein
LVKKQKSRGKAIRGLLREIYFLGKSQGCRREKRREREGRKGSDYRGIHKQKVDIALCNSKLVKEKVMKNEVFTFWQRLSCLQAKVTPVKSAEYNFLTAIK